MCEAGFFVGPDGVAVGAVDIEAEFGEVAGEGPGFEGGDDELIDAFAAAGGFDVHEADVGVGGVFQIVPGRIDAGIAGADEGRAAFGGGAFGGGWLGEGWFGEGEFSDDEFYVGGGDHGVQVIVVKLTFFDSWVHGAFGADDPLFETEEGVHVTGLGCSDTDIFCIEIGRCFKRHTAVY